MARFCCFLLAEQVMKNILEVTVNAAVCRFNTQTRMHSSRMRTARFSGRLYREGGWGCLPLGPGGVYHTSLSPPPPPWTEWLTDRCKNITLPQTSFAGGKDEEHVKELLNEEGSIEWVLTLQFLNGNGYPSTFTWGVTWRRTSSTTRFN